eukprot:TRINITY_DN7403_c0_g4_i1.p1 TRINITY_DN7403_c0_g4~~TRINITY_DN7403_c0_g4_i1.p1  ORF type:complete len:198 (-),score=36.34 TRINITY_DN7403_c0_g4_i1:150-743(-)
MATPEMCVYCFDTLIAHFDRTAIPSPDFVNDSYPLFVTWNKESRRDTQLRGCIGTFKARGLHHGLSEYALTSALNDRRFDPVSAGEIPQLHCSVSLLTNFEDVDSAFDWEVGTHGIWIDFTDPNGNDRNATYLPEVAGEQGWTKEEALESLVRKSGYKGRLTDDLIKQIKLTRYQSSKYSMSYKEYLDFKKEHNKAK